MSTPSRSSLGKYGEDFACRYLQNMGYKLLARNFRCHRYGEIDLIVEKSGCISFIEVKTRASTRFGRPIEAVTMEVIEKARQREDLEPWDDEHILSIAVVCWSSRRCFPLM